MTSLVCDALQISPKAMRELLMDKWGLATHLTDAVMSVWGGKHV